MIARELGRTHAELMEIQHRELVWWKALYALEAQEREEAGGR